MKIEELKKFGITETYVERLKEGGIRELYPPQELALKKGLLEGKNLVVSVPTAGGKTLIAIMAMIKKLLTEKCKVIYVVPLVALAYEKYEKFKKIFKEQKVAISVGDFDEADPWLKDQDIIVVTSEKMDSLIRHGIGWMREIGLMVFDEIHMINDPSRGPTLEVLITRLRVSSSNSQILALSASIKNSKELADWLDAELVESDFRPVKLYEGVSFDSKVEFLEKEGYKLREDLSLEEAIAEDTLKRRWQAFFFLSSRRNAESLAQRLVKISSKYLSKNEKKELKRIAEEVLNVLEVPTKQCKKLSACIKKGVAFHHAGLLGKQKRIVEENFKKLLNI